MEPLLTQGLARGVAEYYPFGFGCFDSQGDGKFALAHVSRGVGNERGTQVGMTTVALQHIVNAGIS